MKRFLADQQEREHISHRKSRVARRASHLPTPERNLGQRWGPHPPPEALILAVQYWPD